MVTTRKYPGTFRFYSDNWRTITVGNMKSGMSMGYTLPYKLGVRYRTHLNSYKYEDGVTDNFNSVRICT